MILQISELYAGYNKKRVLNDVSLGVPQGGIVGVLGPNGAGKSTLLKAIFGLVRVESGTILFEGHQIENRSPLTNIREGLLFSPQGNRIFDELTVKENLEIGAYSLRNKEALVARMKEVLQMYPILEGRLEQRAGQLSGGEKQALALCRVLMLRPKLLLLDEPSLGLAPKLIKETFQCIKEINQRMGVSIVIVEQKARELLAIADEVIGMRLGKVMWKVSADSRAINDLLKQLYLPDPAHHIVATSKGD